jgi:hypothetical protein
MNRIRQDENKRNDLALPPILINLVNPGAPSKLGKAGQVKVLTL